MDHYILISQMTGWTGMAK